VRHERQRSRAGEHDRGESHAASADRRVTIQNLGPNAIYLAATAAKCTTALGLQVPATSGLVTIDVATDELYAIAATALQVSPADTRWYVLGP
jgi:hypothetical protein